ncbi:Uncharacterised protein [Escherichia coli]|nr:Uncharacterised protein [Escherichia coli]
MRYRECAIRPAHIMPQHLYCLQDGGNIRASPVILIRQVLQPRFLVCTAQKLIQSAERQTNQQPVTGVQLSGHIRDTQAGNQPLLIMFTKARPGQLMGGFALHVKGKFTLSLITYGAVVSQIQHSAVGVCQCILNQGTGLSCASKGVHNQLLPLPVDNGRLFIGGSQ